MAAPVASAGLNPARAASAAARFKNLLSPIDLGFTQIKNRTVMGSMHTGLEDDPKNFPRLAEFLAARARGGAGLIVTGGFAPNRAGWVKPFAGKLTNSTEAAQHRVIPEAVHAAAPDAKICLQILHTGRYGYHPFAVAPSRIKAPINPITPFPLLGTFGVKTQVDAFRRCAENARAAGYDGVEVMGSEGYLLNQFIAPQTNKRTDRYGGSYENRIRFPLEVVDAVRAVTGPDFILVFRLSMLDLVPGGSTWDEVVALAKRLEQSGVNIINTGVGWHEARVPTIMTSVPRGGFAWVTQKMKEEGCVKVPLVAVNRINTAPVAERLIAEGSCDMVSMARPMLADANFVNKVAGIHPIERPASATTAEDVDGEAGSRRVTVCIGCNQACLDRVFKNKLVSCLMNPQSARETEPEWQVKPADKVKKVAVIGAGPAGCNAAMVLAERGHRVVMIEKSHRVGGQFLMAGRVPGKEDYIDAVKYWHTKLGDLGVEVRLRTEASAETLREEGFDHIICATGVSPRVVPVPGLKPGDSQDPRVLSYPDVLLRDKKVGKRVAIIGGGGIGLDMAEFITHHHETTVDEEQTPMTVAEFNAFWGIDDPAVARGGVGRDATKPPPKGLVPQADREVWLLDMKPQRAIKGPGKTTGWAHRLTLLKKGVHIIGGAAVARLDADGLHYSISGEDKEHTLPVDTVIVCTGQVEERSLANALAEAGVGCGVSVVGGASKAAELDALRAIEEAFLTCSKV
eukprot:TRINITY_DN20728_c0_g1_i1.p1 TRINITY_DN20728_c0_g1~~TRINITY_DN20728_c0_g1_i1.p1  ORF type:complete len:741 (-),score=188.41 TRINITY_DN20728_c0_g1_i1:617-2839(-)